MSSTLADAPLPCPACGYDLRGATVDRCSECGLEIDREMLKVSGVPWAHRRRIGRIRAFFKTVWMVCGRPKRLAFEFARPQQLMDAQAFRRIVAIAVAITFLSAFAAVWADTKSLAFLEIRMARPMQPTFSTEPAVSGAWLDLALPWSAGATIKAIMPLCLILFAWWLTGAPRYLMRVGSSNTRQQTSALAMAHYVVAPMLPLLPAVIWLAVVPKFESPRPLNSSIRKLINAIELPMTAICMWLIPIALAVTLLCVGRAVARANHAGFGRGALAVAELLFLWLLGAIVLLGLIPWCIGFIWIVFDSFR